MIEIILTISGMLVYEMNPAAKYQGPGEGLLKIPAVTKHTSLFVFNPDDFGPYSTFKDLADPSIADLVTLPDGTQRASIDLKDKELEIGSGANMTARWNGKPGAPIYDNKALETLDWVLSFREMSGVSQTLKGDMDFSSVVSIGLGELSSAGHPIDPADKSKIFAFQFLDDKGKACSVSTIKDHGLARSLVLKADGKGLIIRLKDRKGNPLAAGQVVAAPSGPVAMSITNFPSKLVKPPSSDRQDHLEMLFQAALKNSPTPDRICLPSPPPPGIVTGSSAFCPPMQP